MTAIAIKCSHYLHFQLSGALNNFSSGSQVFSLQWFSSSPLILILPCIYL